MRGGAAAGGLHMRPEREELIVMHADDPRKGCMDHGRRVYALERVVLGTRMDRRDFVEAWGGESLIKMGGGVGYHSKAEMKEKALVMLPAKLYKRRRLYLAERRLCVGT